MTLLSDGRCGHCGESIVRVHELGVEPLPLDVDDVLPAARGGRDELMNYVASCAQCNRSRQTTPLWREGTVRLVMRSRLALLDDFDYWRERAVSTDPAFPDPFLTGLRCVEHGWHICGSPAEEDCANADLSLWKVVPLAEEWRSRFGSRSREVLAASEVANRSRGLDQLSSREVLCHLPRYADDADHALALLRTTPTPAAFRLREPAPSYLLSVTVPLAATNTVASSRRRDFKAARDLHAHLKEHGIDWFGIARLWVERRWPSSHLFYHRTVVIALAAAGKRQGLTTIRRLESAQAVDAYFEQLGSDAPRQR